MSGKRGHSEQRRTVGLAQHYQRRDHKSEAKNEKENIIDLLDTSCYAYRVCIRR